jgi:hypothetical protein
MSKTKTSLNPKPPMIPTSWKRRTLLALALLFCVLGTTWLLQQNVFLPRQERAIFLEAQDKLDTAVAQIANQPYIKNRWCAEAQEKLGSGPLGCHVTFEIPASSLRPGATNESVFEVFDSIEGFEKGKYSTDSSFHNYKFGILVCYIQFAKAEATYVVNCSGNATQVINWIR